MINSKPTYQEIKDDVVSDLSASPKVTNITDDAFILWIRRAQEDICRFLDISVDYTLRFASGVDHYSVQNHPKITAFSAVGVVSAEAHGLQVSNVINVRDLQGLYPSSGLFIVTVVTDANTFTVKRYARATGATKTSPIVVESANHPFGTGDSVVGADFVGITGANGSFTVTNVDRDHFSLDGSVGDAVYGSGGVVTASVNATGSYLGGGRFWLETELPGYFKRLLMGERKVSAITLAVTPESQIDITRLAASYGIPITTSYDAPSKMGLMTIGGSDFLRLFPRPVADGSLAITGSMQYRSTDYSDSTIDMQIALSDDFSMAIRAYVKARIFERIGDDKRSILWDQMFSAALRDKRTSMFSTNVRIARVYR